MIDIKKNGGSFAARDLQLEASYASIIIDAIGWQ